MRKNREEKRQEELQNWRVLGESIGQMMRAWHPTVTHEVNHHSDRPTQVSARLRNGAGNQWQMPGMTLNPTGQASYNSQTFPLSFLTERDQDASTQITIEWIVEWR